MTDVTIQRCTIRVVRRGGWSWGSDPRKLLDAVLHSFVELIARRFAEMWPENAEENITTDIRIRIPIRLSQLVSLARNIESIAGITNPVEVALDAQIQEALKILFESESAKYGLELQQTLLAEQESESFASIANTNRLLEILSSWWNRGVLRMRLASFSEKTMQSWHDALLRWGSEKEARSTSMPGVSSTFDSVFQQTLDFFRSSVSSFSDAELAAGALMQKRVELIAGFFATFHLFPDQKILAALEKALPLREEKLQSRETIQQIQQPQETHPDVTAAIAAGKRETTKAILHSLLKKEFYVPSALPFLLLAPLERTGYLQALDATLERPDLPLFALALAYKVLEPCERGWRRSSNAIESAAVFAGMETVSHEKTLVDFSKKVSGDLAPLNAIISETLIEGHNPQQPLLLHKISSHPQLFLVLDTEGLFPVACATSIADLIPTLLEFTFPLLFISKSAADPDVLTEIDEAGVCFLANANPIRGEEWRRVPKISSIDGVTNCPSDKDAFLLQIAEQFPVAEWNAEELWQQLGVDHISIPLAEDNNLEHALTLAAAMSIGTIAWTLWRKREYVTPLLVLKRFSDLEARVKFSDEIIQVNLPLGRRRQDLFDYGFLIDIPEVPWLSGRTVRFSGG